MVISIMNNNLSEKVRVEIKEGDLVEYRYNNVWYAGEVYMPGDVHISVYYYDKDGEKINTTLLPIEDVRLSTTSKYNDIDYEGYDYIDHDPGYELRDGDFFTFDGYTYGKADNLIGVKWGNITGGIVRIRRLKEEVYKEEKVELMTPSDLPRSFYVTADSIINNGNGVRVNRLDNVTTEDIERWYNGGHKWRYATAEGRPTIIWNSFAINK
jgi:hypothetical protein